MGVYYEDDNAHYQNEMYQEAYDDYEYVSNEEYITLQHIQNSENLPKLVEQRIISHSIKNEISHLVSSCMSTVLMQSIDQVKLTLSLCLFLRCILYFFQTYFTPISRYLNFFHLVVVTCGVIVIHNVFHDVFTDAMVIFCLFVIIMYTINWLTYTYHTKSGLITALFAVSCVIFGEVRYSNPQFWNRIRGVLLLTSMKVISIAFDVDTNKVSIPFPSLLEYLSYCLHPGFFIYGPWLSISSYRDYLYSRRSFSLNWFLSILNCACQAGLCLVLSDCIFPFLFIDPLQPQTPAIFSVVGNRWMMSYCTAISFHFSHFYVSYLAVLTSLSSGVGGIQHRKLKTGRDLQTATNILWLKYKISDPIQVEIPWSMLNVVVAWNIPMSQWLKFYVFDVTKVLGTFPAILFTYAASAMLHGLSFHLAAILISLAFYTYTENALRLKLSRVFNCIHIQARPPPTHSIPIPAWAKLFNIAWVAINIMHLAYLGSMFDSYEVEKDTSAYSISFTLAKWSSLGYLSHWFAFGCFMINWLIG